MILAAILEHQTQESKSVLEMSVVGIEIGMELDVITGTKYEIIRMGDKYE